MELTTAIVEKAAYSMDKMTQAEIAHAYGMRTEHLQIVERAAELCEAAAVGLVESGLSERARILTRKAAELRSRCQTLSKE